MSEIKKIKINGEEYEVSPSWASVSGNTLSINKYIVTMGSRLLVGGICLDGSSDNFKEIHGGNLWVGNNYGLIQIEPEGGVKIGTDGQYAFQCDTTPNITIGTNLGRTTFPGDVTFGGTVTIGSCPFIGGVQWSYDGSSTITLSANGKSAKITLS